MNSISKNIPESKCKSKWESKKRQSLQVAARMKKHKKLWKRACRMEDCGELSYAYYCPSCGHTHMVSGAMCRDRFCPLCGWRLSVTRFQQMLTVLDSMDEDFQRLDVHCSFMTLTVKNVRLDKLRDTLKAFSHAWYKMSNCKAITDLYGWARSYEITYNKERNDYHPHMHLLLFWRGAPDLSAKFNQKIVRKWIKELGLNYVPIWSHEAAHAKLDCNDVEGDEYTISWREDSKNAAKSAAIEASKYTFKDSLLLDIPEDDLPKLSEALHKLRMVAYGGAIKTQRAAMCLDDDAIDDEKHIPKVCPKCGEKMRQAVLQWAGGDKGYVVADADAKVDWATYNREKWIKD